MALHIDRSTVGSGAPLASLGDADAVARRASDEGSARPGKGSDSASISAQGSRLAALGLGDEHDEVRAVGDAETLARSVLARLRAQPSAAAAQGAPDAARVGALLES
jgi:hypothetical protein